MSVLLFWDVDGTLVGNDATGQDLYRDAVAQTVAPTTHIPKIIRHGKTDLQIIREYLASVDAPLSAVPLVATRLAELSRESYSSPGARPALPGVGAALRAARELGHSNTFLTGNSEERTRLKLAAARVDVQLFSWDLGQFGDQAIERSTLAYGAKSIADRIGSTPLILGDTPADAHAARTASIPFCAIATGIYGHRELTAENPILLVDDLSTGLTSLIDLLHQLDGAPDDTAGG